MQEFRDNEVLVAEHRFMYYSMTILLGHCYKQKLEYDKAIELYQAELRRDPEAWDLAEALMNVLRAGKKYVQLMNFIEELSNDWIDGFGGSRLTKMSHELAYSWTYHDVLFEAAKATDNLSLVIKAYENTIDRAKAGSIDQEDIDGRYLVKQLSHHYGVLLFYSDAKDGREEAVRLWEQNLRDTSGKTGVWPEMIQYRSRERLCLAYLQNAKIAELDAEVAKNNMGKLADLCISPICGDLFSTLDADPKLILGRVFHLLQQEEEAMASLRGQVKIALDLLSDDDPSNDWQGYEKLATVLMYIDDDLNAQAAWSLIQPYDEPKAILGGRLFARGPLNKYCVGSCGHQWEFADAIYVCRDCLDVCFDKKCWELVKTKRAVFPVCDHRHDFLYVPEWKVDGQQHVKPGMVKVGDTIVPIDEWLTAIRTTWGLVNPTICGIVQYDFKAEKPDELEAKAGEAITIIAISSPEWFVAKPIGRPGGAGLIPVSIVEVRDMTTGQTIADPKEAVRRAGVSSVEELKLYGLMPSVIPQT
jgi:tetratricopeptide (TPR) repeat protein